MRSLSESRYTNVDELTERVDIVYRETTVNERGNVVRGPDVVRCSVWAKVLPLSSRSTLDNGEVTAEVVYRVVIRHRADVLPNDLVVWRGKRLELLAPPYDAESRRVWTVMDCREVLEHGA